MPTSILNNGNNAKLMQKDIKTKLLLYNWIISLHLSPASYHCLIKAELSILVCNIIQE